MQASIFLLSYLYYVTSLIYEICISVKGTDIGELHEGPMPFLWESGSGQRKDEASA